MTTTPVTQESPEWRKLVDDVAYLKSDMAGNKVEQQNTRRELAHLSSSQDKLHDQNQRAISKLEGAINGTDVEHPGLVGHVVALTTEIKSSKESTEKWFKRIIAVLTLLGVMIGLWFTHIEISRKISGNSTGESTTQNAHQPMVER